MQNFDFKKRVITHRKGALNPLGLSETRKTEIHRPIFYLNPKYTQPVFYPNPNTPDPYLTRPPELTGLKETEKRVDSGTQRKGK